MFHVDFTKVQCLQKLPLTQFHWSLKNFRLTLVWEILTYSSRFPAHIYSKKTRQFGREDKRERNLELYSDKAPEIFSSSLPSTGTIFLRLASKADHTTTTNTGTYWSTGSMKAPWPTNLTTYWLALVSFAPACLSPHTTLAQLLHTSSRVSWTCLKSMVKWWTFFTGLHRWSTFQGRFQVGRGCQARRWRRSPYWRRLAQHPHCSEQGQT